MDPLALPAGALFLSACAVSIWWWCKDRRETRGNEPPPEESPPAESPMERSRRTGAPIVNWPPYHGL